MSCYVVISHFRCTCKLYLTQIWHENSLKRKCHHFKNIFVTTTRSCQYFWCHQWEKFHQNYSISVSMLAFTYKYEFFPSTSDKHRYPGHPGTGTFPFRLDWYFQVLLRVTVSSWLPCGIPVHRIHQRAVDCHGCLDCFTVLCGGRTVSGGCVSWTPIGLFNWLV